MTPQSLMAVLSFNYVIMKRNENRLLTTCLLLASVCPLRSENNPSSDTRGVVGMKIIGEI